MLVKIESLGSKKIMAPIDERLEVQKRYINVEEGRNAVDVFLKNDRIYIVYYWESGKKYSEVGIRGWKKQGKEIIYNETGTPRSEIRYKNSIKTGTSKEWYDNGVLKSEINYDEKGNKSGSARYWDDNGKLVLDENYVNGRLYINGRLF